MLVQALKFTGQRTRNGVAAKWHGFPWSPASTGNWILVSQSSCALNAQARLLMVIKQRWRANTAEPKWSHGFHVQLWCGKTKGYISKKSNNLYPSVRCGRGSVCNAPGDSSLRGGTTELGGSAGLAALRLGGAQDANAPGVERSLARAGGDVQSLGGLAGPESGAVNGFNDPSVQECEKTTKNQCSILQYITIIINYIHEFTAYQSDMYQNDSRCMVQPSLPGLSASRRLNRWFVTVELPTARFPLLLRGLGLGPVHVPWTKVWWVRTDVIKTDLCLCLSAISVEVCNYLCHIYY